MRCVGGARWAVNGQEVRSGQKYVGSAVKTLTDAQENFHSVMMARTTTGAANRVCPGGPIL